MPHKPKLIAKSPVEEGLYRHYKGGLYRVLHLATHSETQELLVVYCSTAQESKIWVRPHSMFIETLEIDGQEISRFAKITDINHRKFG